ncbi:RNA polymerase sigma factor [Streptomyces sp. NPDC046876]|uniref:RNA polymerase sigma factor n=1 Tax=Streptomyces sp. NPDC046876 TaxID=3155616 RepID=UPI0033F91348
MAAAARLAQEAQHGDGRAMEELLDLLAPYVDRICASAAPACLPDAAQEAMIAIFRGIGQLRDPGLVVAWVRTVTVREAVRMVRRTGREVVSVVDDFPMVERYEIRCDVHDVLSRLSPEHRAVLVLRDLEDLDERQVADLLGISVGTVKSRLHRARCSFRKEWQLI